jgi:NAD(P)-dependent dehydrogenase (short-subunit alcohol dehydrogenase family)
MDDLNAIRNVQAVQLDVTSATDIAAAVETVRKGGRGLYGVVNNAGVAIVAPLVEAEERDMQFILNVNLFGPYRITKAFAPFLFESKGRVVNISSLNGFVANGMIGAYSMSKHGVEAFGDALETELAPFGVRVANIEPGNYGTNIGRNLLARADTTPLATSRFARQWRATLAGMGRFDQNPPPDAVADAVLHAFTSENPKHRYLVVPAQNQAEIVIRTALRHAAQLNHDQPFSYDRDALVKMLDEELERVKRTP